MAQFTCEYCGQGFEQKSRYERHLQTSHPPRAPSAADLEKAVAGVEFPASRTDLKALALSRGDEKIASMIERLPDRDYRDAAELARALGEVVGHRQPGKGKPSRKGGARAMKSLSAARVTSLFEGMSFPASSAQLRSHACGRASSDEKSLLAAFSDRTYQDMADVAKEFGRVLAQD